MNAILSEYMLHIYYPSNLFNTNLLFCDVSCFTFNNAMNA